MTGLNAEKIDWLFEKVPTIGELFPSDSEPNHFSGISSSTLQEVIIASAATLKHVGDSQIHMPTDVSREDVDQVRYVIHLTAYNALGDAKRAFNNAGQGICRFAEVEIEWTDDSDEDRSVAIPFCATSGDPEAIAAGLTEGLWKITSYESGKRPQTVREALRLVI